MRESNRRSHHSQLCGSLPAALPVKLPRRTEPAASSLRNACSISEVVKPSMYANAAEVGGPECIVQPLTIASSASSRDVLREGNSGGATSNFAVGKINAKSAAHSEAT